MLLTWTFPPFTPPCVTVTVSLLSNLYLLHIFTKVAADVLLDCPVYRLYILGCISAVFPALDLAGLPVARGLARVARIARDSLAIVGQVFPATAPRISFHQK